MSDGSEARGLTMSLGSPLVFLAAATLTLLCCCYCWWMKRTTQSVFSASFVSGREPFSPAVSTEFLTRDLDEEEQALRAKSDKERAYLYKKVCLRFYSFERDSVGLLTLSLSLEYDTLTLYLLGYCDAVVLLLACLLSATLTRTALQSCSHDE